MKCKIALAAALFSLSASAADFPQGPITIVVPFPPGSSSDLIPRMIAPLVSARLGVPVVVDNKPGANGSLGAVHVANAAADGHTLLLGTTGVFAINQWVYENPRYLPERDFAPITLAASTPNLLVVNPQVQANDLQELVAQSKAQPDEYSFASAGNGSTSHLCGEVLKQAAGIALVHVPYKGPAPAILDVLSGQVSMMCDNFSNVLQYVRTGRLKAIALTDTKRSPLAPQIATSAEQGFPRVLAGNWYGFAAPAATPNDVVETLNAAIRDALKDADVHERLADMGLTANPMSVEDFKQLIAQDAARMKDIVRASGATAN